MNNSVPQQFNHRNQYVLVTLEVRIRFWKSVKRSTYKIIAVELLMTHYLNTMLNLPAPEVESRTQTRRLWFSPWHYIARRQFRRINLKPNIGTHDVIGVMRAELERHGISCQGSSIIYPVPKDLDI